MEMHFHLMRGQPVFPSGMKFNLFGLQVTLNRSLKLADLGELARLGVDVSNYGSTEYARRVEEYSRTQEIGEAAHFLDFDGLVVPSARWQCQNVILFTDRVPPDALSIVHDEGQIDWTAWRRSIQQQ